MLISEVRIVKCSSSCEEAVQFNRLKREEKLINNRKSAIRWGNFWISAKEKAFLSLRKTNVLAFQPKEAQEKSWRQTNESPLDQHHGFRIVLRIQSSLYRFDCLKLETYKKTNLF